MIAEFILTAARVTREKILARLAHLEIPVDPKDLSRNPDLKRCPAGKFEFFRMNSVMEALEESKRQLAEVSGVLDQSPLGTESSTEALRSWIEIGTTTLSRCSDEFENIRKRVSCVEASTPLPVTRSSATDWMELQELYVANIICDFAKTDFKKRQEALIPVQARYSNAATDAAIAKNLLDNTA
jgi:hypothetical protein